jgi:hypothetical protein
MGQSQRYSIHADSNRGGAAPDTQREVCPPLFTFMVPSRIDLPTAHDTSTIEHERLIAKAEVDCDLEVRRYETRYGTHRCCPTKSNRGECSQAQ